MRSDLILQLLRRVRIGALIPALFCALLCMILSACVPTTPAPVIIITAHPPTKPAGAVDVVSEETLTVMSTSTTTPSSSPSPTLTATPTETATSTPTPEPTPGVGTMRVREADGMVMHYVPSGSFEMGTARDHPYADKDEFPIHTVTLSEIWIDQTEVTNAQFAVFLNAQGNEVEGGSLWLDINSPDSRIMWTNGEFVPRPGFSDYPVVEVTWYGARAYCTWAGGRLPTEAEWQYAAGGPDAHEYPWGETAPNCNLAQFAPCGGRALPVGSKPAGASWIGALDMAGNVWEWTADWYDDEYYAHSPEVNPSGPASGTQKMLCGGSWGHQAHILRVADRNYHAPARSDHVIGFRCAVSPGE